MHCTTIFLVVATLALSATAKPCPIHTEHHSHHEHCSKSASVQAGSSSSPTATAIATTAAISNFNSSSVSVLALSASTAETPAITSSSAVPASSSALAAPSSSGATATPTNLQPASHCGLWDSVETGPYYVDNNLWGSTSATSGGQCFGVDSLSGTTLAWHTSWSWAGASSSVKSYANANLNFSPKQLSAITSIPSKWSYTQTGTSLVADVSYDMFLSASTDVNTHTYEIMVWLAALGGAGPISSTGSPVSTTTIAGTTWKLYKGPNGSTTVFSFVADQQVTDFSGDLLDFYKYLETAQGLSTSQYLVYIGAGTEPFVGSNAQLTVTGYSVTVS